MMNEYLKAESRELHEQVARHAAILERYADDYFVYIHSGTQLNFLEWMAAELDAEKVENSAREAYELLNPSLADNE